MLISSFRQLVSPCRLYNKFSHWKNIYIYVFQTYSRLHSCLLLVI